MSVTSRFKDSLFRENQSIDQLFQEENFFLEVTKLNTKLLDFLKKKENFRVLLSYLVESPGAKDTHQRKYQFPQLSFVILESITTLLKTLLSELSDYDPQNNETQFTDSFNTGPDKLLPYFFSFFKQVGEYPEDAQNILSGYIYRIIAKCIQINPRGMTYFIFCYNFWIFKTLLQNAGIKAIADTIFILLLIDIQALDENPRILEKIKAKKREVISMIFIFLGSSTSHNIATEEFERNINILGAINENCFKVNANPFKSVERFLIIDFITNSHNISLVIKLMVYHQINQASELLVSICDFVKKKYSSPTARNSENIFPSSVLCAELKKELIKIMSFLEDKTNKNNLIKVNILLILDSIFELKDQKISYELINHFNLAHTLLLFMKNHANNNCAHLLIKRLFKKIFTDLSEEAFQSIFKTKFLLNEIIDMMQPLTCPNHKKRLPCYAGVLWKIVNHLVFIAQSDKKLLKFMALSPAWVTFLSQTIIPMNVTNKKTHGEATANKQVTENKDVYLSFYDKQEDKMLLRFSDTAKQNKMSEGEQEEKMRWKTVIESEPTILKMNLCKTEYFTSLEKMNLSLEMSLTEKLELSHSLNFSQNFDPSEKITCFVPNETTQHKYALPITNINVPQNELSYNQNSMSDQIYPIMSEQDLNTTKYYSASEDEQIEETDEKNSIMVEQKNSFKNSESILICDDKSKKMIYSSKLKSSGKKSESQKNLKSFLKIIKPSDKDYKTASCLRADSSENDFEDYKQVKMFPPRKESMSAGKYDKGKFFPGEKLLEPLEADICQASPQKFAYKKELSNSERTITKMAGFNDKKSYDMEQYFQSRIITIKTNQPACRKASSEIFEHQHHSNQQKHFNFLKIIKKKKKAHIKQKNLMLFLLINKQQQPIYCHA